MILPHGFRRLCLAERPGKTALIPNGVASARARTHFYSVLKRFVHNKSGYCKIASTV